MPTTAIFSTWRCQREAPSSEITVRISRQHMKLRFHIHSAHKSKFSLQVIERASTCEGLFPHHYRLRNSFEVLIKYGLLIQHIRFLLPVVSVIPALKLCKKNYIRLALHHTFENSSNERVFERLRMPPREEQYAFSPTILFEAQVQKTFLKHTKISFNILRYRCLPLSIFLFLIISRTMNLFQ